MAEEDAIGTNVEDDGPAALPDTPAPAAVAEPPAEPTEPQVEVVDGDKRVPLAALLAEREQAKTYKQQAERAQQLEQELNATRPYVEFLRANPQLMQPKPADPVPAAPADDPDAVEAAQLMDFYKPDGTLDVDKGARWIKLQDRRAGRQAETFVQPLRQERDFSLANQNYARALQLKDADGNSPSPESLKAVFASMTPADMADPRQVGVAALVALGMDRMRGQSAPKPPAHAPLVTEAPGGHPTARPTLSALEQRIAKERGVSDTKWAESLQGYERGRGGVLED